MFRTSPQPPDPSRAASLISRCFVTLGELAAAP
jgi:hypothetical protein